MVPNGWKLTSLGDISSKVQTGPFGSQLHAHEYTDEGIPVLMPKDLINGRADINSAAKITESRADDLAKHKLKKGDILFSRRGDVARFGLITEESEGALCGTGCLKASISKEHSALFLSYFLQKSAVRKWLEQNAVGQTMLNLNTTILSELPIMVASSKQEQQKIAKILSTWDKAISSTKRLIKNSTQQKKALMQQLLTGKRRLLDDEGKRFEGEWEEATVSSFGKVVTGSTPPKNDSSSYDGNISWATAEDFKQKYVSNTKVKLTESGATKARVVPKGSVLVTCIASIGKNAIANEDLATNQQINSVVINKNNSNEFFYYLIEFNTHKLLAWAGTTAVPILNKTSFEKVKFIVPNLKEQQKIATVLTNADREIELLEQQLANLQQEKKALMQVLLTGKKRVVVDGEA